MSRCQICGRRVGLSKAGLVPHHHVAGDACPGKGFAPIEQSHARLAELAAAAAIAQNRWAAELLGLYDRRAN